MVEPTIPTSRRVRLSLLSPFNTAKYLLPLPPSVKRVKELKQHLYTSLSNIASSADSWRSLCLEIDGFELLTGSGVDVIHESDVVTVRLAASTSKAESSQAGTKRRRKVDQKEEGRKRLKKSSTATLLQAAAAAEIPPIPRRARSPSSSSSFSASSSSLSSSSASSSSLLSSSSASSSSSSSLSSSTSSVSILAQPKPSKPPAQSPKSTFPILRNNLQNGDTTHIPPGQGKPSTKERNARRKRAYRLEKQKADVNIAAASHTDSVGRFTKYPPTAMIPTDGEITSVTSPMLVPSEMANRNKKRGFMKRMKFIQGTKTVYPDVPSPSEPGALPDVERVDTPIKVGKLVPPSERTGLPTNLFVTSKEFERPVPTPRRNWQDAREQAPEEVMQPTTEEMMVAEQVPVEVNEEQTLWESVLEGFDGFEVLGEGNVAGLSDGQMIAWKELELDLVTFSPELKLHLGRITNRTDQSITLTQLRPLLGPDSPDEQVGDLDETVVINLQELAQKWRIVPM